MAQILQGNYYQSTKQGYINRGHQTLKFNSKVTHLPVHSKCNELLRSQSHPIQVSELQRVDEVHCFYKPGHKNKMLKIQRLHLEKLEEIQEDQDAVQKLNAIKDYKRKDSIKNEKNKKQINLKVCQNNPETIFSPKFSANLTPKHTRGQMSRQPITFKSQTIILSGKEDPSLQKSPPTTLKNPLKQTISLINLQNSPSSKDESDYKIGINTPKTADMKKSLKFKLNTQNSQQQQCVTERDIYTHEEPNTTISYQTPKHRNFDIQHKLIDQVYALLSKVEQLEQKIKQNQNNFKLRSLQDKIKQADETLNNIQQQKRQAVGSPSCCHYHHSCNLNPITNTSNNLHLFIMFLLGLVIARVVFC